MVIAVVGATGQLGSELLSLWGDRAVGLTRDQLDLADPATVEAALEATGARVVVNAAAYNQVDLAESEPAAAMEGNSQGPRRLARWCASREIRLVHVSSDFVFGVDSSRNLPYTESDETGPLGAYAVSKLGGELHVRSGCLDHLVVRTEDGDLVRVRATPDGHEEVAGFRAIEGKTWNVPALSDGLLFVRNTREMAVFDLTP